MTQTKPALLNKYPQLEIVFEALEQFRNGEDVTVTCPKCGKVDVNEVKVTGVIEVNCECGYLKYREKHQV